MQDIVNRVAVGDIFRRSASKFPEKVAIIEGDNQITYQELDQMANRLANYLIGTGLKKGDNVVSIFDNAWEHVVVIAGLAKAGLVWVPINPGVSVDEKKYILNFTEASLVIGKKQLMDNDVPELKKECTNIIMLNRKPNSANNLLTLLTDESDQEPLVDIQDRDLVQIMFTSGTTGRPKGVMISHMAVYIASLSTIIESTMQEEDRMLALMPMFHCAQHTFIISALHRNTPIVINNGFEPDHVMNTIHNHHITQMFALPMMYRVMVDHPNRADYNLSSLKLCVYAMAPMDQDTLERCIHDFGADFVLGAGQTEMYPATMMFRPEEQLRRFGSYWGTSCIMNDSAVMDEDGNILPKGETGEVVHRGPNVMSGYYKNEEETAKSRASGWHHTGDMGYWDNDGQLVFVDRKKDVIKTGGENVSSMHVESTILAHPDVLNAIVIGLPHEYWIEAVTAVIVLKPNATATEEDILAHCKQKLGGFQVPKDILFVDELPMTATGKIQKHVLRQQHMNHYKGTSERTRQD